ncbi:hypothetical protein GCM10010177_35230 [Actinomadura citrea]|nr:hypothetical protein GCM10010177_35230 [Actinomadura citrea]
MAAERSHGGWYLRLELGTGTDGRRRRVRRGGFQTRKSALEALVRLRGPAGSPLTVAEWLRRASSSARELGLALRQDWADRGMFGLACVHGGPRAASARPQT